MKHLFLLFFSTLVVAQDLRLFYRQVDGNHSVIYLVPAAPSLKLSGEPCTGNGRCDPPQALLLLPKPASKRADRDKPETETFEIENVKICGAGNPSEQCTKLKKLDGTSYKGSFLQLTTTEKIEQKLNVYPGNTEPGERFEAVVELRNVWINGVATTQTVNIPTTLELVFQEDETRYEDGVITFRVTYTEKDRVLDTKEKWVILGAPNGVNLEGVKYDSASRAIDFYIPNLVRQPEAPIEVAPSPEAKATTNRNFVYQRRGAVATARSAPGSRTTRVAPAAAAGTGFGRPRRFKTNAPVVSQDLPLFIRGLYTYNGTKDQRHVFNLEASVAADEGFSLPALWENTLHQLTFTPHFLIDVNTTGTFDNPNSIQWHFPLVFTRYVPGDWSTNGYRRPAFRTFSLYVAPGGENSTKNQTQNLIVPVKAQTRLSALRNGWSLNAQFEGGPEVGHALSKQIDKLTLEPGDNPATLVRTIEVKNRNIRRVAGEGKFNVSMGKKFSLESQIQFRKLYRDEQYIDTKTFKGTFVPDAAQGFPAPQVRGKYTLLETKFDARTRRYFELSAKYAVTDNLKFDVVYKRGVKVPTYEFVNLVMAGFSFEYGRAEK